MIRVKVCGITRVEDGVLASDLGAAAIGLVFWPGSPRFVDPYRARAIVAALPPFVTPVGVFVDQPVAYVEGVAALVRLGAVQLHGSEPASYCQRLRTRVIKALPVGAGFTVEQCAEIPLAATVLLDVHEPVRHGGTGRMVDWELAASVARLRRAILAGGLRAENVADAIATVQPYGIDVSSGVEARPGVKDPARLRDFFSALRERSGRTARTL